METSVVRMSALFPTFLACQSVTGMSRSRNTGERDRETTDKKNTKFIGLPPIHPLLTHSHIANFSSAN
jgi:hypothetical protein